MQHTPRAQLLASAHLLQSTLFGVLEAEIGPLSEPARLLVAVLALVPLSRQLPCARSWRGRPAQDRHALATAFLAKAVYGLETTRQLLERLRIDRQLRCLCGWTSARNMPHESTFSRAFQEFADTELPQRLHEALIAATQRDRLIGHIAHDSTAIEARECFPEPASHRRAQKRNRPKRAKAPARGTCLEQQRQQSLARQRADLPQQCSIGTKKSSKGHPQYWRGYKLHRDVADGQIPISALLTAAHVHDSQVAIPLMTLSTGRVTYLYELMDSAYDATAIRAHSVQLSHQPITDHPKRVRKISQAAGPLPGNARCEKRKVHTAVRAAEMTWAEQDRFRERTIVERVFASKRSLVAAPFAFAVPPKLWRI